MNSVVSQGQNTWTTSKFPANHREYQEPKHRTEQQSHKLNPQSCLSHKVLVGQLEICLKAGLLYGINSAVPLSVFHELCPAHPVAILVRSASIRQP